MTALVDQPVAAETTESPRTGRWPRWALAALLAATAVLYLWNLSASGYGNTFYAAAAQAGSQSWSAWFFGSLDAQNFITVDKPPASLWVTGLSVRLFGMSSWAVMAPQALMGVAAVASAVLRGATRVLRPRPRCGRGTAGRCGAGASRPAAALMFRFNNPDALLVLLLTVAAYCLMRAATAASWRWLHARRHRHGHRVSHQDAAGLPGAARLRPCLPACCADVMGQACTSRPRGCVAR